MKITPKSCARFICNLGILCLSPVIFLLAVLIESADYMMGYPDSRK